MITEQEDEERFLIFDDKLKAMKDVKDIKETLLGDQIESGSSEYVPDPDSIWISDSVLEWQREIYDTVIKEFGEPK